MYIEDPEQIFGCFRCGELMGDTTQQETGALKCESCGETSIVTFVNALDIINDMHLRGSLMIHQDEVYIDEEL